MPIRLHTTLLASACLMALFCVSAQAADGGDRVQFGSSIVVGENEQAGSLVCIGCSIHMQGSSGDVVAIGGSVIVDGTVKGDVVTMGGGLRLTESARVDGDTVAIGGGVMRDPRAEVKGDVVSQSGFLVMFLLILVPLLPVILIVGLIWWLVSRNRPRPIPIQVNYPQNPYQSSPK